MVTRLAEFSTPAAAASDAWSGLMTGITARTGTAFASGGESARNTAPGITTTPTPPRASAVRIAISSTPGSCSGMLTNSE
jgi:hypothetical protein